LLLAEPPAAGLVRARPIGAVVWLAGRWLACPSLACPSLAGPSLAGL
jgi:hypothetical protein